jgi:CheY-like chemotaxis protein
VDTSPGKGSSFQIYLPITEELEKDVTPLADATCKTLTCPATILMAEDDDMVRSLAMEVLEDAGYTVIEAVNGQEAVDLFTANRDSIDLVLLDVIMPKMTGQQAWEKIHELSPDLPVIFSSGYSFNELKKKHPDRRKGPADPETLHPGSAHGYYRQDPGFDLEPITTKKATRIQSSCNRTGVFALRLRKPFSASC